MTILRSYFSENVLDTRNPDLGRFIKSLDVELFLPQLQAGGIQCVNDLKRVRMTDLRRFGLTIGAARRIMAAAADVQ